MDKKIGITSLILIVFAVILIILFSANRGGDVSQGYMDISAVAAKQLIDNNSDLVVIDVSPFYEEGHIPGAVWYYYGDGSLDAAIPNLDKNKKYLVYCHFDGPSISGAQSLIDAGFEVYRLTDHFSGWVDAGFDVEF